VRREYALLMENLWKVAVIVIAILAILALLRMFGH
jgi:hypothetical protein